MMAIIAWPQTCQKWPCMGFTNKVAPDVSEEILCAEHESSDLKNSKCRIQYGDQVNLIKFHKPRLP